MHLRTMYILFLLDEIFYIHLRSSSGLTCHLKTMVGFFNFSLDDVFIDENGTLKYPTITVLLSISVSLNICFIYLSASMLGL